MLKTLKYLLLSFLLLSFLNPISSFARDSNGVEVDNFRNSLAYGLHIDHFTNFDPTETAFYIYNEAAGSSISAGSVAVGGILDGRTVCVSIPTLGSGSILVRIEGKVKNMTTWSNVYTFDAFTSATTIDSIVNISEYLSDFRIGVRIDGTNGTDVINIRSSHVTHR